MKNEGEVNRNLNYLKQREKRTIEERNEKIKAYRIIWKKLLQNNPECSRNELAHLNPTACNFLKKFDKDWYINNSPSTRRGTVKRNIHFYKEKDNFLLKEAQDLYKNWYLHEEIAGKLIRRTYTGFYERLKAHYYLNKKKEMVPNTVRFVLSVIETSEDFQKRKFHHLLTQYSNIENLPRWRIHEMAGVRGSLKPEAEAYLEELIRLRDEENR